MIIQGSLQQWNHPESQPEEKMWEEERSEREGWPTGPEQPGVENREEEEGAGVLHPSPCCQPSVGGGWGPLREDCL